MLRGKIKPGTICWQDRSSFRWPGQYPVNTRFDFKPIENRQQILATADGFGYGIPGEPSGKYGNGSIDVFPPKKVGAA